VKEGKVETVCTVFPDHYGRLVGKRFEAEFFLKSIAEAGTHACNYLLVVDMEMNPREGFRSADWSTGFGDYHLAPDLDTIRLATWQDRTAFVFCDVHDQKTHHLISVAPRSILKRQIDLANEELNAKVLAASELEYYTFTTSFKQAREKRYNALGSISPVVEDYHILQSTREEPLNAAARRHLTASGVPIEGTKGEAGRGQHELNVIYGEVLRMSDAHLMLKQCVKEIADSLGWSVTFMAKPDEFDSGSSCHIHLNLVDSQGGKNLFAGTDEKEFLGEVKCSREFRWFLGGWMKHMPDMMVFYAPTVNSYKRYQSASWAPTKLAWSCDNRTAGFRVVGEGKSLRIECRIPGADCNPYLGYAASIASGLDGIRNRIEPPKMFLGDVYSAQQLPRIPFSFQDAINAFSNSEFAKKAFGEDVVEHYARHFQLEQNAFLKAVTDWERVRYFEQI